MNKRYVAVDLDETLAEYDGWKGLDYIGKPKKFSEIGMKLLKDTGFDIIIYTCRSDEGLDKVKQWLEKHDIPYDYINENPEQPETCSDKKVFAHYYIDDRNACFDSLRTSIYKISRKELNRKITDWS